MGKTFKNIKFFFQNNKRRLILLLVLFFAVILVMDYNSRMMGLYRVTSQLGAIQTQEGKMALTVQYLHTEIAHATSQYGVIDWARDENMVLSGDIPVEPLLPHEATPTATPVPVVTTIPPENWQVWVLLFFGIK